jgi:hypothetical protein
VLAVFLLCAILASLIATSLGVAYVADAASRRPWRLRPSDVMAGLLGAGVAWLTLAVVEDRVGTFSVLANDPWYVAVLRTLGRINPMLAGFVGAALATSLWRGGYWLIMRDRVPAEPVETPAEPVPSAAQVRLFRRLCVAILPAACALHVWGYVRLARPGGSGPFLAAFAMLLVYWMFAPAGVGSGSNPQPHWSERALKWYVQIYLWLALAGMGAMVWSSFDKGSALAARLEKVGHAVWLLWLTSILMLESSKGLGWTKRELVSRREQFRPVLEAEVKRWSSMPWEQIVSELAGERNDHNYQVQVEATTTSSR